MVGGGADVADVGLAEEAQHRVDQATDGIHRPAVRPLLRRARVVRAEQLEGGIDQVDVHGAILRPAQTASGSRYSPKTSRRTPHISPMVA